LGCWDGNFETWSWNFWGLKVHFFPARYYWFPDITFYGRAPKFVTFLGDFFPLSLWKFNDLWLFSTKNDFVWLFRKIDLGALKYTQKLDWIFPTFGKYLQIWCSNRIRNEKTPFFANAKNFSCGVKRFLFAERHFYVYFMRDFKFLFYLGFLFGFSIF
jgi:hypothetical protein